MILHELWVFMGLSLPLCTQYWRENLHKLPECSLQWFYSPVLCFVKSVEISVVVFAFREFTIQILPPVLWNCSFKAHVRAIPGSTVLVHRFLDIAVLLLPQDHCL